jgi:hypothetical protein
MKANIKPTMLNGQRDVHARDATTDAYWAARQAHADAHRSQHAESVEQERRQFMRRAANITADESKIVELLIEWHVYIDGLRRSENPERAVIVHAWAEKGNAELEPRLPRFALDEAMRRKVVSPSYNDWRKDVSLGYHKVPDEASAPAISYATKDSAVPLPEARVDADLLPNEVA